MFPYLETALWVRVHYSDVFEALNKEPNLRFHIKSICIITVAVPDCIYKGM